LNVSAYIRPVRLPPSNLADLAGALVRFCGWSG